MAGKQVECPNVMRSDNLKKHVERKHAFPSPSDFDVAKEKTTTMKWGDLPRYVIYKVNHIKKISIESHDGGSVAELENAEGVRLNVWLTRIIMEELEKNMDGTCYIRSLGPKPAAESGRIYHNFDIVKR